MRCDACRINVAWGGVFVSPAPAYADGYVAPDGNIYYGYKSDANYSKQRIKIEVHYYSSKEDADKDENRDPLGQFVRVKYVANLNSEDNSFDKWAFRPMWWYGVPAGLTNVHNVIYSRFEKYTKEGKPDTVPGTTNPGLKKDSENTTKHYRDAKDWKSISRFYITDPSTLTSKNGLAMLLGVDGGKNKGYDPNGTNAGNWKDFYDASKGMQGMFIDWESAGKRFYEMTYVAELTDDAWKNRDEHPLRFAAGVYRFAGNWHIATGQIHRAPKIADSLKVQYPALTPVAKADGLTPDEKTKVTAAIKKANENTKHFTDLLDKIEVDKDGTATLTFHDNTTIKMPGKLLVVEDKKDNVKFPPVYPAPMGVVNPQKLSTDDQNAIIAAFKKENAGKDFLNKVKEQDAEAYTFDNNKQELTINYKDNSKLTIPYSSLVYQGATIADWAPYVVPAPIEVTDPSKLDADEQKKVTDAFDTANADLDVYTAAKKNGATPVSFDKDFKNAIITWADGSTTEIPSWQFLKKKAAGQTPTPKPPTPKPAEEKKTFTVDLPADPTQVAFDPFDKNANVATDSITSLQKQLMKRTAKDANDPSKSVTITSATISIADGTVTFKAEGYEDKVYPIGIFYKKRVNGAGTQNPAQQTPTSKTDTVPGNEKDKFIYNVRKIETDKDNPTVQDAIKALKQFVRDNYDNVSEADLPVSDSVTVNTKWTPKAGTKNMGAYGAKAPNDGPMTSFSIDPTNGFAITVHGHPWDPDADNGADWNAESEMPLFTINASDLYVKKGTQQTPKDNTIEKLKELAKQLRDQRKKAGELTDDVINTLGATDDKINSMNDEQKLRDLIKKIADYQKPKPVEYKYNFEKLTLTHEGEPNDDDYKKIVVDQFLKKNYTTNDWSKLENAYSKSATVLSVNNANTYGLTPATSGTSGLNIYTGDRQAGGVTSVVVDSNTGDLVVRGWKAGTTSTNAEELIRIKKADLYTPKSKEQNPALTPEQLQQMKEDAKKIIDRNPNLTPEQKKKFKGDIDNANDQKGIQDVLDQANTQANKNKTDPNVQQTINDNKNGEKEKKDQELKAAKEAAKNAIENLPNLTEQEKNTLKEKVSNATSIDGENGVNSVLDEAKKRNELEGVKKEAKEEAKQLYFLDHGTGADVNTADTHDEDAALNSVLGSTPEEDSTLKALDGKLQDSNATADDIRKALEEAKKANVKNTQKAKDAATKKLEEKKDALKNAYDALTPEQQNTAKTAYEAAIQAIDNAESSVKKATKPSQIKTALESVKDETINAANQAIEAAKPKRDASGNTDNDAAALQAEKDAQIKRISESDLPADKKQEAIGKIHKADKLGDPTGIANRYLKAKKIEAAKQAIDNFEHLNNAQKEAFKAILKDTDASDHENADGTTSDDIDDVLANAANTDNAMARLEELEKKANDFKNEKYGKYSQLTGSEEDQNKKKAFDDYLSDATTLTKADKGADKSADEVNTLYDDLLKAMCDIDPNAKSAGLKTDALKAEIDSDNTYKPATPADPAKPGNPVYNTSSKEKKDAFDKALGEAQTVLKEADTADISTADKESAEQKEIDAALEKLVKARLALDGVDTTDLQNEIGQESTTTSSDAYKYDSQEKQNAYNNALNTAKELIKQLTSDNHQQDPSQGGTQKPKTQAEKQKAVNEALANLKAAEEALKGKKPIEPTPTPTPSVDKSHLQQGINDGSDVHNSDEYNNAPSDKKQAYDHALYHANEVNNDPNATQDQVNQAAEDLKKAENDLKPTPTPLPSPVPGGAGFGVNDNAPTTVDKGELNIQIDSAEADSQPGNAGAGNNNAGNTNAGNAANSGANAGNAGNAGNTANNNAGSNANAANGANSAAVDVAVESNQAVKQADAQVAKAQAALDAALAEAKKVAADPNATQAQVDAAAQKLSAARKALADAKAHADEVRASVRASVRAQVLKRSKGMKLSKTGSNVSAFGVFAAGVAAAGVALFVSKRRGISRHSSK
ncbi:sugar-binding protein [Gardnerella sp. 2492]|uniref:sugar-binding protein n=1 Tax=Gardnerella sp. 2492 TaxID=3414376 RepID=UPI003D088054